MKNAFLHIYKMFVMSGIKWFKIKQYNCIITFIFLKNVFLNRIKIKKQNIIQIKWKFKKYP